MSCFWGLSSINGPERGKQLPVVNHTLHFFFYNFHSLHMALQARGAFSKQNSDLFWCYKLLNIPLDIGYYLKGISTDLGLHLYSHYLYGWVAFSSTNPELVLLRPSLTTVPGESRGMPVGRKTCSSAPSLHRTCGVITGKKSLKNTNDILLKLDALNGA